MKKIFKRIKVYEAVFTENAIELEVVSRELPPILALIFGL